MLLSAARFQHPKRAMFLLCKNFKTYNIFMYPSVVISKNHDSVPSMFGGLIFEALPLFTSYQQQSQGDQHSNHSTACVLEFFTFKVEMT